MFRVPEDGQRVIADYFLTGMQLSLEGTKSYFGKANTLRLRASGLVGLPLSQAEIRGGLRILFVELGFTAGYRTVWRNLVFEPGKDGEYCKDCGRKARRNQDPLFGNNPGSDHFGYFEGRLQFFLPFNDGLAITGVLATRFEDRVNRSYDWFFADVHDKGWAQRMEWTVFFRHRRWGAIGPYIQMLRIPRDHGNRTAWALGFNAVSRLGLISHDDMVLLTFLARPGDPLYGQHAYYSPVRALLVYRMQWDL